ncbi:DUF3592 domain-containing protein [Acidovorax sp. LjRoot129]|uniref:DUF3592 domain-containing protein n=1 Tax=Acidovorax sp. LjRoot129 TaxID=3342260 RepID=UPI003ED02343
MKRHQQGKLLFKLLGAAAGLVFVIAGFNERSELTSIQKRGKRAVVEPITQYTEFSKRGSSTYTAEFRFTTDDGRKMVVKHSFPEEVLADFKASKPVEIVYMPADPSNFVFAREKASWTLVAIGAALFLAALVLA